MLIWVSSFWVWMSSAWAWADACCTLAWALWELSEAMEETTPTPAIMSGSTMLSCPGYGGGWVLRSLKLDAT
jgi:hypothetical protein